MEKIELYLFILSLTFNIRFIIEFVLKIRETNPTPMKLSLGEKIAYYLSISYIITYIITIFRV